MSRWWQQLGSRDRRVLQIGGLLAVLLLGYSLLWQPLQADRDLWHSRAIAADQSVVWMRAAAPVVAASPSSPQLAPADGRSLLARIDLGAREAGLGGVLLRVEPINADQVRVYFQSAPFDRLMEWLQPLAETQDIRVDELSLQRASGVGLVDARLTLAQAGG